ncbi:helix-turn-helix transcriptional regulator [Parvularcula sp. ZS-1/3]|uniref:Helix-turn-helix transcriptional regulator n=1 Tax=Parvularcula mediterranea TaxID=2732508 RepID=A0A7Y3RNY6_9PROT|nr:helix-turn-helix transcriptional regulator [Parvularcula mediterranea]NNU17485.1 helix-turn-helix transcriptional regulator [Parvularcula mediterranea]
MEFCKDSFEEPQLAQSLGNELLFARQKKGLTQSYVASEVGLKSGSTIQRFEAGERCPGLCLLVKMAALLEFPLERFVTGLPGQTTSTSSSPDAVDTSLLKALVKSDALITSDAALRKLIAEQIKHLDPEDLMAGMMRLLLSDPRAD